MLGWAALLGLSGAAGLGLPGAQAADVRAGVQASFVTLPLAPGGGAGEFGLHLALFRPLNAGGTVQVRQVLEGGLLAGSGGAAPLLRYDADLLGQGAGFFYGAGAGTGLILDFRDTSGGLPSLLYSPLLLANVHASLGRDFGAFSLEGLARLGLLSGLSLRASIPLR